MRPNFAVATALLLLLGTGVAEAADSDQLAQTGGFLLGNAHRCGVPISRVDQAGKVIHDLIVAASDGATEETAADRHFVEVFMASAFPDPADVLIPPCKVVIAQFEQLEWHHRASGMN